MKLIPTKKSLHEEDRKLVRRLLRGSERAYESFFDHYFPGLYRFALSRLGQETDVAEEVAQAAIAKAVRKLATYRGEAPLFSWLCTFCRHEIGYYLERVGRAPDSVGLIEDVPEIRAALESLESLDEGGPEAVLLKKEIAHWVRLTLDHLPRRYAQALEWKYLHDLPVREIATRLGVGTKAAESILTRARAAFHDAFASAQHLHAVRQPGLWRLP